MKKVQSNNSIIDKILSNDNLTYPAPDVTDDPTQIELVNQYKTILEVSRQVQFPDFDIDLGLYQTDYKIKRLRSNRKKTLTNLLKIAAVILFGVFSIISIHKLFNDKSTNQFIEIFVKQGEKLSIKLPDGNCVWLNSNTTIKYPVNFYGLNKRIEINGEAYFDLKNNTNFPLVISANKTLINCTSAVFNIKSDTSSLENTELIVIKGWVIVSNSRSSKDYEIKEGSKVSISKYLPLAIEPTYSQNELAWKTGKIIFDETPMQTVASTLSRYYNQNIKVEGDLRYCNFSSSYDNTDISIILNDIKSQYKPSIIQNDNNNIIIRGDHCN